jgi:uncharacterized damage-inducible protein DinB
MKFDIKKMLPVIQNTPNVLNAILSNLTHEWTNNNEGENTWTVKEVVAHLIVCEETNWMPRIKTIRYHPQSTFTPIDMQAHFKLAQHHSLPELLFQFSALRKKGVKELQEMNLNESDLLLKGMHPILGEVKLYELVATWATHDLAHIAQIARIMARQNHESVGSFKQYLNILK